MAAQIILSGAKAAKAVYDGVKVAQDYSEKMASAQNDLFYIKIRNTPNGNIEVFRSKAKWGFKSYEGRQTNINLGQQPLGQWAVHNRDLYFFERTIERTDGGNAHVLLHLFKYDWSSKVYGDGRDPAEPWSSEGKDKLGNDKYLCIDIPITRTDAKYGKFVVSDSAFFFIPWKNESPTIDIYIMTHKSGWQDFEVTKQTTTFKIDEAADGPLTVWHRRLLQLKTTNRPKEKNNRAELHATDVEGGRPNYDRRSLPVDTWFQNEHDNGIFEVSSKGDITFVKTRDIPQRKVEVHWCNAYNGLSKEPHHHLTAFSDSDVRDGVFLIDKVDNSPWDEYHHPERPDNWH